MKVNTQNAEFIRSAASLKDCPRDGLPQIAFAGRSFCTRMGIRVTPPLIFIGITYVPSYTIHRKKVNAQTAGLFPFSIHVWYNQGTGTGQREAGPRSR